MIVDEEYFIPEDYEEYGRLRIPKYHKAEPGVAFILAIKYLVV